VSPIPSRGRRKRGAAAERKKEVDYPTIQETGAIKEGRPPSQREEGCPIGEKDDVEGSVSFCKGGISMFGRGKKAAIKDWVNTKKKKREILSIARGEGGKLFLSRRQKSSRLKLAAGREKELREEKECGDNLCLHKKVLWKPGEKRIWALVSKSRKSSKKEREQRERWGGEEKTIQSFQKKYY